MANPSTRTSSASNSPLTLRELAARSVSELRSVSPKLEERLAMLGITTAADLLQHYPRRYHDRTRRAEIAELTEGEEATVFAEIKRIKGRRTRQRRSIVEAEVFDGSSYLRLVFFNQPWRERQLGEGTEAAFFGKVEQYRGRAQMTNPIVDVFHQAGEASESTGAIVPVYPASGKAEIFSWQIRKLVRSCLEKTQARGIADPLEPELLAEFDLVDREAAYWGIHRPREHGDHVGAADRLKFDEFLRMQLHLVARKRALEAERRGIVHITDGALVRDFHDRLAFELTGDQRRSIAEIDADLASPVPMHRLLQGDVGAGKTVVALHALLVAVQGGYQGALMAPTEVLAEQHLLSLRTFTAELSRASDETLTGDRPVRTELLTNRVRASERARIAAGLAAGDVDLVVGTHALIYEQVEFARLGVAVVDEQHRFGVEQRSLLRLKGNDPDVLVMTATPIPRTAAMLIYGDLDLSELHELPPGRTPIVTEVVSGPMGAAVAYERLRAEVEEGHQAYVVCPLVEGSENIEAKAATEEYARLESGELAGLRLGLLHGQLPSIEKESVMREFRQGTLDVLVATTVIEVGVDVANATVMVVEDADRFGLSQLHQLRGRVGRGVDQAYCFLVASPTTTEGTARMEAMAASTDGFVLAERDLEIRGAGEVFGERQAGFTDLKLGRIPRDEAIVRTARRAAERLLDADHRLRDHEELRDEVEDLVGESGEFLFKS